MPYIEQIDRIKCDKIVDELIDAQIAPNGQLNYILFKYCKFIVGPSYNNYKNFIGELNETVAEIRRRFLAPYEDEKIKENGDVD